jgi:hypothetical protein
VSSHGSRRHPWHLVRCEGCRKFVISSAPRCPNCGEWRASARAISFAMPAFAAIGLVAILTFLVQTAIRIEKIKAEERAALLQNSKQQ